MPCKPVEVNIPDIPSNSIIDGLGSPFSLSLGKLPFDLPEGFPENLLDILDKLQMLLPSGIVKPSLSFNYDKTISDAISKLLNILMPFLMLYKFLIPLLNLIICVIEVICALNNPFALRKRIRKLFRVCLPAFLNLFPIFALIVMIISLLLLLLELIKYIIQQIIDLINAILANLKALYAATADANEEAIIACAGKIADLLCIFQNIFAILLVFNIIVEVIKEMLSVAYSIPPCDSDSGDCCTSDVCPGILKNGGFDRSTGTLSYTSKVTKVDHLGATIDERDESWQFYDSKAPPTFQLYEIAEPTDVNPNDLRSAFFAQNDSGYVSFSKNSKNYNYSLDLTFTYNPADFGRRGKVRKVTFEKCIIQTVPTQTLTDESSTPTSTHIHAGVVKLVGGLGKEEDGSKLMGFEADGITPSSKQATLENFIYTKPINVTDYTDYPDMYTLTNVTYVFNPYYEMLYNEGITTLGCDPTLNFEKQIGNEAAKVPPASEVTNAISGIKISDTIDCLNKAVDDFRANLSEKGAVDFIATSTACLGKLTAASTSAIKSLIDIGFSRYKSTFFAEPQIQFTTQKIIIKVDLKDNSGTSLTSNLPESIANIIADKLSATITLGTRSNFVYDGSKYFVSEISSKKAGKGTISVIYDNQVFYTYTVTDDLNVPPTNEVTYVNYEFIESGSLGKAVETGIGDTEGNIRFDESDVNKDS
jgi:hypothetical protein